MPKAALKTREDLLIILTCYCQNKGMNCVVCPFRFTHPVLFFEDLGLIVVFENATNNDLFLFLCKIGQRI